ncbi:hypothetical protein [Maribacter hydrothermalis]|uniref:Uncharacterized protein n=1 Tax=Maribacter hydrothermalis TaxID=1836467 RepID=A0A1B7Z958_9FLAO|nr:hypothetical protein [Maribacter hydrothermalis]APQ18887.1 hypothetical protein BTR34_16860 [Maribacter hydrothermalis]OBR39100.1 hypothetical protein A9200_05415 [Maribacter hydrothermalis]
MISKAKRKKAKKKIFLESLLVFFIAISPFLYKVYDYLPYDSNGDVSILGIIIGNHGFPSTQTFLWFLTSKIVPLYLMIFWFLTSRDWWYHIIIIPIAMYAFQLFEVFYDSDDYIDTDNIWWLIPICMITIPIVYFIRIKLYDKHVHGIDLEAMDAELKELKDKNINPTTKKFNTASEEIEDSEIPSLSDELNTKLSTGNIENILKGVQERIQGWLNFKF